MNILFLTLSRVESFDERGIYIDLLNYFREKGHYVCVASPVEKREGRETEVIEQENGKILRIRTGNVKKVNFIEKGISTVLLEKQYKKAIHKYLKNIKLDLILYSTPPITLQGVVKYLKNRNNAHTYLLLKDIFPQNAVDIGIFKKRGIKGCVYKYFRNMESKLYAISDYIGCMSQANVEYVLKHNPEIEANKVEVCPNSIRVDDISEYSKYKEEIYLKYEIPRNKKIFIYGGNLGKPQGIDFVIKCLRKIEGCEGVYFIIVGSGTEYSKLAQYIKQEGNKNVCLLEQLPKKDYDILLSIADVGLIFLDKRFTIPNFPSRLLAYMQMEKPVLAVTDKSTDIGKIIEEAEMGGWCLAEDESEFLEKVKALCQNPDLHRMGVNGKEYLKLHYTVEQSYDIIMRHFKSEK